MNNYKEAVQRWISRIWDAYNSDGATAAAHVANEGIIATDRAPKLLEISGIIAYERNDFDLAIAQIGDAMREIRLSFASQFVLAKSWLKTNRQDDAESTLVFLVEMIEQVPCHMLPDLTQTLASIGRDDLALVVCRTACDRHPEDDNAVFGVAFYMHRCEYPTELVKNIIAKAIELHPNSNVYRVNMAAVCCTLEYWNEAYEHACRLPDSALSSIPCKCMVKQLRDLFERFDDHQRLGLVAGS